MSFFGKIGAFFAPKNEGLKLPAQQITSTDVPINAEAAKKSLAEWMDCWQEYRLRDLAFNACVNLIAKAIANCEFKTYQNGEAVKKD